MISQEEDQLLVSGSIPLFAIPRVQNRVSFLFFLVGDCVLWDPGSAEGRQPQHPCMNPPPSTIGIPSKGERQICFAGSRNHNGKVLIYGGRNGNDGWTISAHIDYLVASQHRSSSSSYSPCRISFLDSPSRQTSPRSRSRQSPNCIWRKAISILVVD